MVVKTELANGNFEAFETSNYVISKPKDFHISQARKIPPFKVEQELLVNVLCLKLYKLPIFRKNLLKLKSLLQKF